MVSRSTVSPLISASHSVLGKPAGALDAHLIHLLTVPGFFLEDFESVSCHVTTSVCV
jgi:hypothetical protein